MFKVGFISVLLRSFTLGSKFLLLFVMARALSPEDVGVYGLITTSIGLSLYVLGMDFYVFNTREILSDKKNNKSKFIRDQFVFHFLMYIVVLPLLIFMFIFKIIPLDYIIVFYLLLIFEHLSQEFYRLFITFSRPLLANILLFIRSGIWILIVCFLWVFHYHLTLTTIFILWLIGAVTSVFVSVIVLKKTGVLKNVFEPINWDWIRKGFFVSLPFFISTIIFNLMQYIDRYILQIYHGEKVVGVYTFYMSIANAVQVFIFTGIFSILSPKAIKQYQASQVKEYRETMRKMTFTAIVSLVFLVIFILLGIKPLLNLIGKETYIQSQSLIWILLIAVSFNTISQTFHYSLYVRGMDRQIFLSTMISFTVALIANLMLVPNYSFYGAAISLMLAMISLFSTKMYFSIKSWKYFMV
ncbi:oligosaccharide flippase family protein [Aeribacillus pallidus]|uniref:oligosaccharide flippase family protein n=1 Tax=Aeribacillus pallidus TaxID=33936 RepID=UPI000E35770F|nr:oligosaccharide flippase family protein [Aeribacillus pallidus]